MKARQNMGSHFLGERRPNQIVGRERRRMAPEAQASGQEPEPPASEDDEDTEETEYTLKAQGVPDHVVNAVVDMTKVEGESYADYMVRVAANPLARKVKIADMLDNLSDDPTPKQIKKYARGLLVLVVE